MLAKQDTGNIQGLELVHMKNKGIKKLLSGVQKSEVVLGEFWDMIPSGSQMRLNVIRDRPPTGMIC